ncbi:helix-turn-helix domain protein [bacterium BMS3Abin14]|nr:helix-turn-helix domain protein [bacterium BMS3Abin14]
METDKWLTLDELAEYLKLSRTKLYRMAQEGEIPASKIGTQWRFNRQEIDDWVTSQRPDGTSSQRTENGRDGGGT